MDRDNLSVEEDRKESRDITYSELYEKYDIKRAYQHPSSYDEAESYYGGGKYPPDWSVNRDDISDPIGGRREAVYEFQRGRCARCNRSLDEYGHHCHHYHPLSEQGTNELENLVGLCEACHKLIHPGNDQLDGDWRDASLFPHPDADRRVATIRRAVHPLEDREYGVALALLEATSAPGENHNSTSDATYSLSATDAITARDSLDRMLQHRNLDPDGRAIISAFDENGSPATDRRVDLKLYFESGNYDPVLIKRKTDSRGTVELDLPEHNSAYARLYNSRNEQVADTELEETSEGWQATLETPSATVEESTGESRSSVSSGTATGSQSSTSSGDGLTTIVLGSLLAPFYLAYIAVKYIVLFFLGILMLNIVVGVPIAILRALMSFWSSGAYGSGVTYLVTFVGLAFVVSWAVFWMAMWDKVDE